MSRWQLWGPTWEEVILDHQLESRVFAHTGEVLKEKEQLSGPKKGKEWYILRTQTKWIYAERSSSG